MSSNIEKLEVKIADILTDRTSSNGTPYAAIVLPSGEWVFVWEGDWKQEIEQNKEIYDGLECEIYVVDKEEDPDDHFYNLKALVPQDPEIADKLLQSKQDQEKLLSEEERDEQFRKASAFMSSLDSR